MLNANLPRGSFGFPVDSIAVAYHLDSILSRWQLAVKVVLLYFSSLYQYVCFQLVAPKNPVFALTATVPYEAILYTPDDS
jgi:hypothetical protein